MYRYIFWSYELGSPDRDMPMFLCVLCQPLRPEFDL